MDINMPGMDGHTASKLIKEFRPDLPIIAQTGFALDEEKEKYSDSFDDYITKPIKTDELKKKIRNYLKYSKI
jgi:CheY-like chemotaxis protein